VIFRHVVVGLSLSSLASLTMPPDTAVADGAAAFHLRAVRKSFETFRSGRDLHHSLACVASLGHIGLCGDVAEWLKAAVC
jgi:hypothetical protein